MWESEMSRRLAVYLILCFSYILIAAHGIEFQSAIVSVWSSNLAAISLINSYSEAQSLYLGGLWQFVVGVSLLSFVVMFGCFFPRLGWVRLPLSLVLSWGGFLALDLYIADGQPYDFLLNAIFNFLGATFLIGFIFSLYFFFRATLKPVLAAFSVLSSSLVLSLIVYVGLVVFYWPKANILDAKIEKSSGLEVLTPEYDANIRADRVEGVSFSADRPFHANIQPARGYHLDIDLFKVDGCLDLGDAINLSSAKPVLSLSVSEQATFETISDQVFGAMNVSEIRYVQPGKSLAQYFIGGNAGLVSLDRKKQVDRLVAFLPEETDVKGSADAVFNMILVAPQIASDSGAPEDRLVNLSQTAIRIVADKAVHNIEFKPDRYRADNKLDCKILTGEVAQSVVPGILLRAKAVKGDDAPISLQPIDVVLSHGSMFLGQVYDSFGDGTLKFPARWFNAYYPKGEISDGRGPRAKLSGKHFSAEGGFYFELTDNAVSVNGPYSSLAYNGYFVSRSAWYDLSGATQTAIMTAVGALLLALARAFYRRRERLKVGFDIWLRDGE